MREFGEPERLGGF